MAQPGQSSNGAERCLEEIQVQFLTRRPKGRIQLDISLGGGQPPVSREFGRNEAVLWNTMLRIPATDQLAITICERRGCIWRKRWAQVTIPPDRLRDSESLLENDPHNKVRVTLRFSDTNGSTAPAAWTPVATTSTAVAAATPAATSQTPAPAAPAPAEETPTHEVTTPGAAAAATPAATSQTPALATPAPGATTPAEATPAAEATTSAASTPALTAVATPAATSHAPAPAAPAPGATTSLPVETTLAAEATTSAPAPAPLTTTSAPAAATPAPANEAEDPFSKTKASLAAARARVKDKKVIYDRIGRVRTVVGYISRFGDALGDLHPAVKFAFGALDSFTEACENQEECRDTALDLIDQLDAFVKIGARMPELDEQSGPPEPVHTMLQLIGEITTYICEKTSVKYYRGLLSNEYMKKITEFKDNFAKAVRDFELHLEVEIYRGVEALRQDAKLKELRPAMSANYRSSAGNICLEGTRISLLSAIVVWLEQPSDGASSNQGHSPLYWLYGSAGSGKSTVAKTIATDAARGGHALICFFCRRDNIDLANPRRFFATLAYFLARLHAGYRRAIYNLLCASDSTGLCDDTPSEQYKKLFEDILPSLRSPPQPYLFIGEALDECGSPSDQALLARNLVKLTRLVSWVKVFATSREEPKIKAVLGIRDEYFTVTSINKEIHTEDDIRQYIRVRLLELSIVVSEEMIHSFATRASGLFIWCTTVFRQLEDSLDPHEMLTQLLSRPDPTHHRSFGVYRDLYALYDQILDLAIKDKANLPTVKSILGLVYISSETSPLSRDAIAALLGCKVELVHAAIQLLHAVLYEDDPIPGRLYGPVRVHHNSFRDFIRSNIDDASPSSGWTRLCDLHALVAHQLLKAIVGRNVLKFNICDLDGPPVFNSDIKDLRVRISKHISAVVEYGLLHWIHHLTEAGPISEIPRWDDMLAMVAELVGSVKVLVYLEALSLLGATVQGAQLFYKCAQFFKGFSNISEPAADVEHFISSFAGAMQSAAHLYLSAMSWAPERSYIGRIIAPVLQHSSLISSARDDHWDSSISTTSLGSDVWCVAYSPDGERIACGLENGDIRLLDARTGSVVGQALRGHSGAVYSVMYSHDGSQLASGSKDESVRLWDATTGAVIGEPLRGHSNGVLSVTFSPDGTHLASGAHDHTVRIWSTKTRELIREPLRGHSASVRAVAYAPDGRHLASASDDATICIWEAATGAPVCEPFRGHTDRILSIMYSPDGKCLVSGSADKTLRIWNAHSGELIRELQGHTDKVFSVVYSPSGKQIASASRDSTVRLWDAQTGQPIGEPLRGHSNAVFAVAFSSDGLRVTSGSDDGTVRIWSVQTAAAVSDLSHGHSDWVLSVACSPNGAQIASGSADHTVCIWDGKTGAPIGEPLRGHTDEVNCVAYSPNNRWIASGSDDRIIRLWDAGTGAMVGEPLRGHSDLVRSVAFSPDSMQLASGSDDHTVRRWDALTGEAIGEPLDGHSSAVLSVSYSPNGALIASGSADKTVQLWNARNGEPVCKPLQGHSERVLSVAFSRDGKRLASASEDQTIRLWDVETGAAIGEPLRGHTSNINSVAYSPDGRYLASASSDRTLRIWDAGTGEPVDEPLQGHGVAVASVAYSPDGLHLISGSLDNTICIWDLSPPADTHWHECRSRMNPADGWIRDGDRPLLWVPFKYRDRLRCRNTVVIGRNHRRDTPEVDVEKVWAYAEGTLAWTSLMNKDHIPSTA